MTRQDRYTLYGDVGGEQRRALDCIAGAFGELEATVTAECFATAVLARLVHLEPPMLVVSLDEVPASEPTREDLDDALDALEEMVVQYLDPASKHGGYDHASMAAGENAADVLARLRPDKWMLTAVGVARVDAP